MPRKQRTPAFELIVTPFRNNEVKFTLYQWRLPTSKPQGSSLKPQAPSRPSAPGHRRRRVVSFWGFPLAMARGEILELLRQNGHPPSALGKSGKERNLPLQEEQGVRLGLLFQALKPLRKSERMEAAMEGIRRMTAEEAYYWFSKTANGAVNPEHRRALRALRLLLAEE